jgi:hypothetical protein
MESNRNYKHIYYKELIKAGVEPQKAEQAARNMTEKELLLIAEIWENWADVIEQTPANPLLS